MIHYLLLKFRPGTYHGQFREQAEAAYQDLARQVEGITSVQVMESCVVRDSNADLMVRLELSGPRTLAAYLEHPIHRRFAEEIEPCVSQRLTFDHMETEEQERRGRA